METIPSFYKLSTPGVDDSHYNGMFSNNMLRLGEVQEILYPDDKLNRSKKFIEYNVLVYNYENGTFNSIVYHNCMEINSFAGLADKMSFTLRADDTVSKAKKSSFVSSGLGSKVLVLCLNGARDQGVIIGGVRDDKDETEKSPKEKGHNLHFNFNGIDLAINKDGELILQYQGKTEADGKINKDVDKNAVGTTLTIHKNGNFVVSTKDNKQTVTINHEKKTIDIVADSAYTVKAKDVNVAASGSVAITDKSGTSIKGSGVKVGDATDAWMKGTSYRSAQAQMHSQVISGLTMAATALPFFQMGTAASGLMQVVSAIVSFEAQSLQYLSKKNKTD